MVRAINALLCCRTPAAGLFKLQCDGCDQQSLQPRSCGHRSCVQCQHHETSRWLDRQVAKLLPETGKTCFRTLKGEDFCWLVLQHVLPKGFRRVRDYGFLHGNAKTKLRLVQRWYA